MRIQTGDIVTVLTDDTGFIGPKTGDRGVVEIEPCHHTLGLRVWYRKNMAYLFFDPDDIRVIKRSTYKGSTTGEFLTYINDELSKS